MGGVSVEMLVTIGEEHAWTWKWPVQ